MDLVVLGARGMGSFKRAMMSFVGGCGAAAAAALAAWWASRRGRPVERLALLLTHPSPPTSPNHALAGLGSVSDYVVHNVEAPVVVVKHA